MTLGVLLRQPAGPAERRRSAGPGQPADLRLVPPAIAVWAGAFTGTATGGQDGMAFLVAAVLAGTGLLAAGTACRALRQPGVDRRLPPEFHRAVLAASAGLLGGLAVGALHVAALRMGPVDELAAERATAAVTATVSADPRPVRSRVDGLRRSNPLVVVPVRVSRLEARGREWAVRAPVLVIADDSRWSGVLPGAKVAAVGRLARARSGQAVSAVLSVRGPPVRRAETSAVQQAAGALRAGLRSASAHLPPAERGLLPGLVVGDTSRVPAGVSEDFRTAGLTHLTAVSGANLAIVTGFVLLVGRRVGIRGRALPVLAAVAMAGFVVLARPQPSVVRAAAMGAVALAALASGRPRRSLAALAATVVLLVLIDPWLSRSHGFVLSVLATGGLVLLAPRWGQAWQARGLPGPLAHAIAVPVAAQVACSPVVVLLSGQVSVVAVLANLLAAPAVAPATVLGVMATLVAAVAAPVAQLLATVAGGFVWWVATVARHAAGTSWAAVDWPASPAGALGLAALSTVSVLLVRRLPEVRERPGVAAGLGIAALLAVSVPATSPGWPPRGWLLAACDVGQGDALVLSVAPGTAVVIDAGPEPQLVDRCLRGLGVERVPVVVLTHLHADHVEGLPGVLRGRDVGEVQLGRHDDPANEFERVRRWTTRADVPLTRTTVGDRVWVGPVAWRVIWPDRVIQAGSVPNNASTVAAVRTGGVRILLTGDIEPEAQRALLATGRVGVVDVLKVAHHGSAYQATELLSAVRPRVALISAGADNDYGHPAPSTLRALRRAGALVGRTDRDGTLVVVGSRSALRLVRSGR